MKLLAIVLCLQFAGFVVAGEKKETQKPLPSCCRKVQKADLAAKQRRMLGLALQLSPQAEDDKECDNRGRGKDQPAAYSCKCSKSCIPPNKGETQRVEDPKCTKHCKPNLCKCAPVCKDVT